MSKTRAQIAVSSIPDTRSFKFKIDRTAVYVEPGKEKGVAPRVKVSIEVDRVKVPPDSAGDGDVRLSYFDGQLESGNFYFDISDIKVRLVAPQSSSTLTELILEFDVPGALLPITEEEEVSSKER